MPCVRSSTGTSAARPGSRSTSSRAEVGAPAQGQARCGTPGTKCRQRGDSGGGRVKVVICCGGVGMRLREYSESVPKPMVPVGYRPILWHVMRYYAHFGHKDFILCLGYKGDSIKKYFLEYDETVSNDFVFSEGGRKVDLLASDIGDWKITFVDTGLTSNIGMRLKAVQPYLSGEEMFLAHYSDRVSDLPLPAMIDFMTKRPEAVACFAGVAPYASYHLVSLAADGRG